MILRLVLFAMMGVGLVGFGIFGWRAERPQAPPQAVATATANVPVMLDLLVAAHDLAPGTFVRPADLSTISVAAAAMPPGARRDTPAARAALAGALVLRQIQHGSVPASGDLLLAGGHGFLAAMLAPGMRAFTIPHEQLVSDAGLIWPGDRLDLILTQQMPDTPASGRQIAAETVLTDLRVLAIDRQLVQPEPADPKAGADAGGVPGDAVTVEVSPAGAERLAVALRLGKVAFAIRSATAGIADQAVAAPTIALPAPGSTTWAGNVMHSLDQIRPASPPASLHVFEGGNDTEYKF